MFVYIVYFVLIIVLSISLKDVTRHQLVNHKRVTYLFLTIGMMWLMMGLRDINVGVDTRSYVNSFLTISLVGIKDTQEPLFKILTYVVRLVTDNYNVYFFVTSFFICNSLYKMMSRYFSLSSEVLIGICIFFVFGIYSFSVAAMRQTIALAFVVMAVLSLERGKWKFFIIWVLIATGFHNTAILSLLILPLKYFDLKWYGILVVLAFYCLSLVIPRDFASLMIAASDVEGVKYGSYGKSYQSELSLAGFYLQLIPMLLVYVRRNHLGLEQKTKNLFLNSAYIGLGVQTMTTVVAEFYRISFYFCVFDIVLISLALTSLPKQYKTLAKITFVMGCLLYMFFIGQDGVLPLPDKNASNYGH